MSSPPTPMLKVTVLHDRDQYRDEETWQKWWSEELMPRIMPFALKHGIDQAELYFTPSSFKKDFQEHLDDLKSASAAGWSVAPYDAAAIYWTTDLQNIRNMISDPDWKVNVREFAKGWIDTTKMDVQVGTQVTFIENGKVVEHTPSDSVALGGAEARLWSRMIR